MGNQWQLDTRFCCMHARKISGSAANSIKWNAAVDFRRKKCTHGLNAGLSRRETEV